jgi:hypothetical protein
MACTARRVVRPGLVQTSVLIAKKSGYEGWDWAPRLEVGPL